MNNNKIIQAWYISRQRIPELVQIDSFPISLQEAFLDPLKGLNSGILANNLGPHILEAIRLGSIPSLHELILKQALHEGSRFVYQGHFFGKGFGEDNKTDLVSLSEDLSKFEPGAKLIVNFSKNGITTSTGHAELSGSINVFLVGAVTRIEGGTIRAVPYVIGNLMEKLHSGIEWPVRHWVEVKPNNIAELKDVDWSRKPTKADILKLKAFPEAKTKAAFADLFSQLWVPKDWGGEQCDLTAKVSIDGQTHNGAFIFKEIGRAHV
jgi:hypothetical protein